MNQVDKINVPCVFWPKTIWPTDIWPIVIWLTECLVDTELWLSFVRQSTDRQETKRRKMFVGQMFFDQKAWNQFYGFFKKDLNFHRTWDQLHWAGSQLSYVCSPGPNVIKLFTSVIC
jgi:hypothetical protein